jgi:phospholipase C
VNPAWRIFLRLVCLTAAAAQAQYPPNNPIRHVVVIVQENRTPDNLFQGLCAFGRGCGPGWRQYDIASTYVDANGKTKPLQPVGLAGPFDKYIGSPFNRGNTTQMLSNTLLKPSHHLCELSTAQVSGRRQIWLT